MKRDSARPELQPGPCNPGLFFLHKPNRNRIDDLFCRPETARGSSSPKMSTSISHVNHFNTDHVERMFGFYRKVPAPVGFDGRRFFAGMTHRRRGNMPCLIMGKTYAGIVEDSAAPLNSTRSRPCGGKIYYELAQQREGIGSQKVALVRVEQFYPFAVRQPRDICVRCAGLTKEALSDKGFHVLIAPYPREVFFRGDATAICNAGPAAGSMKHAIERGHASCPGHSISIHGGKRDES